MPRVDGITNNTSKVVTPRPNVIVAAIGMRYWACNEVSNINADRPPIVVQDVSITGLNLSQTPEIIASSGLSGFSANLLSIVATRIMDTQPGIAS